MANRTENVDVQFRATGLGKLKEGWADFAGELLEPMAILAAGGTKVQALWSGMRGVFLSKVLGPLGAVVGAATGFLILTRNLVKEWKNVGINGAKAVESLTVQLKPLLGSLDLAKRRAREIFDFAVKSPFQFSELAEGNKILQGLTMGALATKAGMELVGDAAAVANSGFADTARSVGRLYDGLMSGRPVGEAAMRLQELGLISGQTRNQIESMQAANAAGSEIWKVVEKDLQRTKGAMLNLSEALVGLETTYEDTRQNLEAGFGEGFMEGEKAGVKSATQVMERMTPVARYLGEMIGTVSNYFANLKAKAVDAATGFPGFATAVQYAALTIYGLAAAITAATGGLIAKFLIGVISATVGNRQLAASAAGSAAAQAAQAAATNTLAGAQARLILSSRALASGQYLVAGAHARAAAAQAVGAVRTSALAAGQGILRGGFVLTGKAIMLVTRQMWGLAVAIAATPMFWLAAALVAVGGTMLHFYNKAKKAREELEAYSRSSRAIVSNLQAQAREIRTVSDQRRVEADAVRELAQAHLDLRKAQDAGKGGEEDAAAKRAIALQNELDAIRNKPRASLDKDTAAVEREDRLREQLKQERESRADFQAGAGFDSEQTRARAKLAELQTRKDAAENAMAAEEALALQQEALQRKAADLGVREPVLTADRENIKTTIAGKQEKLPYRSGQQKERLEQDIAKDMAQLADIEAALDSIQKTKEAAAADASRVALESNSELAVLREKLKLHDAQKGAADDLSKAEEKAAEAKREELQVAKLAVDVAKRQATAADAAAKAAGIGADFSRQAAERDIARIEAQRTDDLNPATLEEARQRMVNAELGLAQARIDAESQVASLRLKGYEREKEMLGFERQKLQAALERGRLDRDGFERQSAVLDAQEAAMEKSGREKGVELKAAFEIANLRRREEEFRRTGDPAKADALRAAADAKEDARTRREAAKEAEDVNATPEQRAGYVTARVAEEQAARAQQRNKDAEDQALARDKSTADQRTAADDLRARVLQAQGRAKEARQVKEAAAREQDEINRREKQDSYRAQGFRGEDADRMASKDVKTQQAQRLMEEMLGRSGNVVATSLAAVGGGGNVAGSDPSIRLQERMVRLLEQIGDNTKDNVDGEDDVMR